MLVDNNMELKSGNEYPPSPPTKGVFYLLKWRKKGHMGNFLNKYLLALKELMIKD